VSWFAFQSELLDDEELQSLELLPESLDEEEDEALPLSQDPDAPPPL
jgi:hypothetical protein